MTTTDPGSSVVTNGREAPRGTTIKVMMILVKTIVNHVDTYTVAVVQRRRHQYERTSRVSRFSYPALSG
jgi:hypothetical protein